MADDSERKTPRKSGSGGFPRHIRRGTVALVAIRSIRAVQAALWHAVRFLLALIVIFEEWGWQPLSKLIASLARIKFVARLEVAVAGLPPYPALGVFLLPSILFLPLKLGALWLIAKGYAVWAAVVFIIAKIGGTALYARIFQLTQPTLMKLSWFARAYNWFMPWKELLIAQAKATPVWRAMQALQAQLVPHFRRYRAALKPLVERLQRQLRKLLERRGR